MEKEVGFYNFASKLTMKLLQKISTFKVTFANGDSVKSWKTSNSNIVKVTGTTNGKCTLTAGRTAGKATITVRLKSGLSKNITITVKSVKTTKITGIKKSVSLKVKNKMTLKPILTPNNSTEKITYKFSNPRIADVNSKGVVTAKKKGTVTVTVKSGSKSVKCKVTVK